MPGKAETMRLMLAMLAVCWVSIAHAQTPTGQSIADGSTFGAVATLAPLCGLRDEAWSSDLRSAAMQTATGSTATDNASLISTPGAKQITAALGYGDMEALENFAADKPAATCAALRDNPALRRADAVVDGFRLRRDGKPVG
jgi:hypothetical protein